MSQDDQVEAARQKSIETVRYVHRPFTPEELAEARQQARGKLEQGLNEGQYAADFVLRLINSVDNLSAIVQAIRHNMPERQRQQIRAAYLNAPVNVKVYCTLPSVPDMEEELCSLHAVPRMKPLRPLWKHVAYLAQHRYADAPPLAKAFWLRGHGVELHISDFTSTIEDVQHISDDPDTITLRVHWEEAS
jgi:hypothetical protein